jgi:very-short-patch-repair endonuclease
MDHVLAELAASQCGLFSRAQVLHHGGDDDLVRRRLGARRWLPMAPGVYSLPGWEPSWRRSLWLAHLDVGPHSVVSHEAAAAVHGLAFSGPAPVVLTVPHGDHERPSPWEVHQLKDLRPGDVTDVDGLPVTTTARTLFDLAAVTASRGRYERMLDEAHVSGRCRVEEVRAIYDALRRRGKPGMRLLAQVLEVRGPGDVPPASELERRLLTVLRQGGLPRPKRQFPLPWRDEAEGRVDLAYPDQRVLLEADGRRWHSRMDQMATDRRRDREALSHGWRPYRFVWEEITRRPELVCATVYEALAGPPSAS